MIASRSEQDAASLTPPPVRQLPTMQTGDEPMPTGDGLPPPSQRLLDGLGPAAATRDPNTID